MMKMKRAYSTPKVKMVDFSYDDQVVAASMICQNYTLMGKDNPTTCYDEEKDSPVKSRMVVIGCTLYMDNY